MNISRRWSLLLPLILLAFSADGASAAPGATTPPSRETRPDPVAGPGDTVVRFLAALRAGDYETVLGLLDPQVIVYESGSVEHSRDEYAAHHMKADAEFLKSMVLRRTAEGWRIVHIHWSSRKAPAT